MYLRRSLSLPIAALVAPSLALASTQTDLISQIAGLFYIVVGLALVAAFLMMGTGMIMWLVRLGTDLNYRDRAIHVMEWAVATLFGLVLVLGVVEFIQTHTSATLYLLSVCIVCLIGWLLVTSDLFSGGHDEEDH